MKTVTCENFGLYGDAGGIALLLYAERFPLRKTIGARVIHVNALSLHHFTDGTIQVVVGTKYCHGRMFRLKVCRPRKARKPLLTKLPNGEWSMLNS